MRKTVVRYVAFLGVCLAVAYWASMPAKDKDPNRVDVLKVDGTSIARVTYTTEEIKSDANRAAPGKPAFWIDYEATPRTETAPGDGKTLPPPKVEAVKHERFLASDQFKDVLASLNPLVAMRALGKVKEDDLGNYGLKTPEGTLTFYGDGSDKWEFKVGKLSYGTANRFVQRSDDGMVYLVDGRAIDLMAKAKQRMYEFRIFDFEFDEVTAVQVKAGDKTRRMIKSKKSGDGAIKWTDDVAGDKEAATEKPSYATWLDKFRRLRPFAYASRDQDASLKNAEIAFEVIFEKDGKQIESLVIKKTMELAPLPLPGAKTDPKKAPHEAPAAAYWVTAGFLGGYAKLTPDRVEALEKDLATLF